LTATCCPDTTHRRANRGTNKKHKKRAQRKATCPPILSSLSFKQIWNEPNDHPTPRTHVNPKVRGDKTLNRTLLAKTCDRARTPWITGQGSETATIARENLRNTNKDHCWQSQAGALDLLAKSIPSEV
jgi:hypothetical protein